METIELEQLNYHFALPDGTHITIVDYDLEGAYTQLAKQLGIITLVQVT